MKYAGLKHVRLTVQILAIAVVAVPLLATGPAQAAARAANPAQVFAGTVVTAAGTPVAGQKVSLYVTPDSVGKSTPIGTATTGSDGRWSLPAPAFAVLPKAAQQAATADMGYLNVETVALSGGSLAVAAASAWVGTVTQGTEPNSNQPLPMMMKLMAAGAATAQQDCCGRFGCGPPLVQKVLGRSHAYTVVGEYHGYWDASGGVTYTRGAESSIGSSVSVSDGPWNFNGYDSFSTSRSLTMGFPSNGAHNSHQMVVSLKYVKRRFVVFSIGSGAVCDRWRQIDEDGLYDPGHGWTLFKRGKNVIKDDGKTRYHYIRRHHPRYIDHIPHGGFFQLDSGQGNTYGGAADVFGVGIQAETTHSSDVAQAYTAGNSHFRFHWVWGSNGNLSDNPKIEYSY
jgi:hypothetical protein